MKKHSIFLITLILVYLCLGCTSQSEGISEDFAVLKAYGMEHVLSKKDSDRLRELLDSPSGWSEGESCDCMGSFELLLDGVQYAIDIDDTEHPIHYGQPNGNLKKAMINGDKDVVKEIYRILDKWSELKQSYEYFLMNNQKSEDTAILTLNNGSGREYTIGKEETEQLRKLFAADAGWMEKIGCECIGKYEITIDNIRYVIDTDNISHGIKYGKADGSAEDTIYSPNGNMQEICKIIKKILT